MNPPLGGIFIGGKMYVELTTDDYELISRTIEEHKDATNPVNISLKKKNGLYSVCVVNIKEESPT